MIFKRNIEAESAELLRLRKSLGLTQPETALALKVSPSTYYRWEAGEKRCQWSALELMRIWEREHRKKGNRK